jgi:hypothetical protein
MDNTVWQCDSLSPWTPTLIGTGFKIGSPTNEYNNSIYWIDARTDSLYKDGINIGELKWYADVIWDAQLISGFTISSDGKGWYAGLDDSDGNTSFLVEINLQTAHVVSVGPLGYNNSPVNGIIAIPEPNFLLAIIFTLLCIILLKWVLRV